jgi:hypothetical protein
MKTPNRAAPRAALLLTLLALLAACETVVTGRLDGLRKAAGRRGVPTVAELTAAARANAVRMCNERAATPSASPLAKYGGGTALEVKELVGVAVRDPAVEPSIANLGATDAIWASWKSDPTLLDARWDGVGVGEHSCADGRLYMTLVLRDAPAVGLHPQGKTSLFMGQELGAVGGFPGDHDQGYVDYVGMPAGVTIYTDLRFPFSLQQRVNFGSGDLCGPCYLDNPAFDGAMLAIGLYMVGDLPAVVAGERDANIELLGNFIRSANRPVLLRIGYEFDGSWNGYDPTLYQQAFRRIMDRLRAKGVLNVAAVWQSSGYTTSKSTLLRWYPGDEYVDWVAYSYFKQSNPSGGMMAIARERGKPVMIAESTPQRNLSLGDPVQHWNAWFAPFFAHVHANADVIKAVAYINTRWFDQPAWGAGWGDSRVQIRPEIKSRWIAEMQDPIWDPGDFAQAANEYVLTENDLTPP